MASVYGTDPYNVVQLGRETTPGTPVAATIIWRGPFGAGRHADPQDQRGKRGLPGPRRTRL